MKLVWSVLIFWLRTGIDHPEWGPAGEEGIMLKNPKTSRDRAKRLDL